MASETGGKTGGKEQARNRALLRRGAQALPYAIGGIVLIAYFVWMCIEMSSQSGSGALPLGIFGGVLLGMLAGGASLLSSRRHRE